MMDAIIFFTGFIAILALVVTNIAVMLCVRAEIKSFEMELYSWKHELCKKVNDLHVRIVHIEERTKK